MRQEAAICDVRIQNVYHEATGESPFVEWEWTWLIRKNAVIAKNTSSIWFLKGLDEIWRQASINLGKFKEQRKRYCSKKNDRRPGRFTVGECAHQEPERNICNPNLSRLISECAKFWNWVGTVLSLNSLESVNKSYGYSRIICARYH